MKRLNPLWRTLFAGAITLLIGLSGTVHARQFDGMEFDDEVQVGGRRLALNGIGLRELYVVKTWVAALYTPEPVQTAARLVGETSERRITVTLLADLPIDRLARDLLDSIRRNLQPEQISAIDAQVRDFVAALQSIGPTVKGDTLILDMIGDLTQLRFNELALGDPIAGIGFRNAVLIAFVGADPVDDEVRRGLLGLPPASDPAASDPSPSDPPGSDPSASDPSPATGATSPGAASRLRV